jgi:hypothetical protein
MTNEITYNNLADRIIDRFQKQFPTLAFKQSDIVKHLEAIVVSETLKTTRLHRRINQKCS